MWSGCHFVIIIFFMSLFSFCLCSGSRKVFTTMEKRLWRDASWEVFYVQGKTDNLSTAKTVIARQGWIVGIEISSLLSANVSHWHTKWLLNLFIQKCVQTSESIFYWADWMRTLWTLQSWLKILMFAMTMLCSPSVFFLCRLSEGKSLKDQKMMFNNLQQVAADHTVLPHTSISLRLKWPGNNTHN